MGHWKRKVLLLVLSLVPPAALGGELLLPTPDLPPLAIHASHAQASGIGVEIIRELAKRTDTSLRVALIPASRLIPLSTSEPSIIPNLTRAPDREGKFRWVGEVLADHYCFVTLKKKKAVLNVEEAKRAGSVGVNRGSATEAALKKTGITNISAADGATDNIRKLNAGVIDAWFSNQRSAFYAYKGQGFDPDDIVCLGDIGHLSFWIATSLQVPEEQFRKLQDAFEAMKKDGSMKAIFGKYE